MQKKCRVIAVTAPSGAGKTTIIKYLLNKFPALTFSVSATTRAPREGEINGKDYHFLPKEVFLEKIKNNEFLEWEEVYEGLFYGSLKSEVIKNCDSGKITLFDVDVHGAMNIKSHYGEEAFVLFVKPPSLEILIKRLTNRQTEDISSIEKRVARMKYEMSFETKFDHDLLNDELKTARTEAEKIISDFLKKS
ncbi:MAG: guanylate kinase [Chitinophagaceae bacterium]|nr:MAG: guanylate kinase [Chitinophagaceae bacterium]